MQRDGGYRQVPHQRINALGKNTMTSMAVSFRRLLEYGIDYAVDVSGSRAPRGAKLHLAPPESETEWSQWRQSKLDGLFFLSQSDPPPPQQRAYDAIWNAQRQALLNLLAAFETIGVPVLVFKSAEFYSSLFANRPVSFSGDIDLLVPRKALSVTKAVLLSLGYCQGSLNLENKRLDDVDMVDIAIVESKHYELFPFKRLVSMPLDDDAARYFNEHCREVGWAQDGVAFVLIEIDIHHRTAVDLPPEPFFEHRVPSTSGKGETFSDTDHLWFTTCRYYHEVALHQKRTLRDLAFIGALLATKQIDWDRITWAARQYELHPSLYYFLKMASVLARIDLPRTVESELSPLRGTRAHDWGWQYGKLFGVLEPCPLRGEY